MVFSCLNITLSFITYNDYTLFLHRCSIKIFKHYVTMDWTPEQSTVVSKFHQGSDICQHQISSGKHPGFQSIFMLNNQSIYQFHAITNFFISATK